MAIDPRELIVTRYLAMLAEPPTPVEPDLSLRDVLDRLRAIALVYRQRARERQKLEEGFVAYAAPWATANRITYEAFVELGVPEMVLEASGLRRSDTVRELTMTTRDTEADNDVLVASSAVLERKVLGTFTASDVAAAAGVSIAAAEVALTQLLASQVIESAGTDPWHKGKGKRQQMYIRARRAPLLSAS